MHKHHIDMHFICYIITQQPQSLAGHVQAFGTTGRMATYHSNASTMATAAMELPSETPATVHYDTAIPSDLDISASSQPTNFPCGPLERATAVDTAYARSGIARLAPARA